MSQDAHRRMIAVAGEIIFTDGVAECTIDEVARRSGIAKTTIYRHFGSAEALVLAVVGSSVGELPSPDTGSLRGDLQAIQRYYFRIAENPHSRALFTWMLSHSMADAEFAAAFRRVRNQPRGPTVVAFQRAIARGEIDPETDIDLALHLFQGPFISKRIIDNEPMAEAEFHHLLDLIVRAVTR